MVILNNKLSNEFVRDYVVEVHPVLGCWILFYLY